MPTRKLKLPDLEISCDDLGEARGLPILLLHGFTGHRDDFDTVRDRLATWTRVLVPDLRGHGDAVHGGGPDGHSFERLVADVGRVLDALDVPRCHLLGHSMGGMIALRFTLDQPARVASLVLMDTSCARPTGMKPELLRRAGEIAQAEGMLALQARVEKRATEKPSTDHADQHLKRWADRYWPHMRKRYDAMDPNAYMGLGQAMANQAPVCERLPEIQCPTLVMVGCDDDPFLEAADSFERGIADAVRVTIADAGHHPHQENPAGWWAAMEKHWARVRSLA